MKRFLAVLAVGAIVSTLFVDVALAGRANTTLSMRIDDTTVRTSDVIHVRGKLRSEVPGCRRGEEVELYIDGALYATTRTGRRGTYHFRVQPPHPRGNHTFQTRFAGTTACQPSQSDEKTVRVRR
jgi:hypothetical protein